MAQALDEYFHEPKDLVIFSHGLDIISYLFNNYKFELHAIGGIIKPEAPVFFGPQTEQLILSLNVNKVFLEVDSVIGDETDGGLLLNNIESSIFPKLVHLPGRIYFLADSTKFQKLGLYKVVDLSEIPCLLTN